MQLSQILLKVHWLVCYTIDRVEEGLETEVPSKYHPCISAVLIEAYFLTRGLNMNNS